MTWSKEKEQELLAGLRSALDEISVLSKEVKRLQRRLSEQGSLLAEQGDRLDEHENRIEGCERTKRAKEEPRVMEPRAFPLREGPLAIPVDLGDGIERSLNVISTGPLFVLDPDSVRPHEGEEKDFDGPGPAEVDAVLAWTEAGHTYHCAARQVWGDGSCECGLTPSDEP